MQSLKLYVRSFSKLLLVLAFSFMDVSVKSGTLSLPNGCVEVSEACAFLVKEKNLNLHFPNGEVRILPGSSVIRSGASELNLVRGRLLVSTSGELTIKSLYGEIQPTYGLHLIEASDDEVTIYSVKGDLEYKPRHSPHVNTDVLRLKPGFQVSLGPVSVDGVANVKIPDVIPIQSFLNLWSSFYDKQERSEFLELARQFQPTWRRASQDVGPWYVEMIQREIAKIRAEEDRIRRIREARQKERNYYREMFRRRNFIE